MADATAATAGRIAGPTVAGGGRGSDASELFGPFGVGPHVGGVAGLGQRVLVLVEHVVLVERFPSAEDVLHPSLVDGAGPAPDEDGGNGVAGEVRDGPRLGHEPVDADDEADAVEQVRTVALQATGQRCQAGTAHTR